MLKKKYIEHAYILLVLVILAVYGCIAMAETDNSGGGTNMGLSAYAELFTFVVCIPYLFFLLPELKKISSASPLLKSWMWYFLYVSILLIFLPNLANLKGLLVLVCHNLVLCVMMLTMYIYIKRNGLSTLFLTMCFCVMMLLVIQYIQIYSIANQVDSYHVGGAYYPLFLLPILMLHPWKTIRYLSIIIIMVVLFSSMKRGGLAAFVIAMLVYLLAKAKVSQKRKIQTYLGLVISLIVLVGFFIYLGTQEDNYIFERFMNLQEDEGSGRLEVWTVTWNMIMQSNFIEIIFGHGYNAVLKESYLCLSAHNDWLEVWYDYGLIALILLVIACSQWLKISIQLQKKNHQIAPMALMLGVIVATLMMISHVIIYPWMIFIALSLGVLAGILDREKEIALYAK